MLGTWQPTFVDRSPTDSSPAASDSSTQRRLGSASARPTAAYRCRSRSLDERAGVSNIGVDDVTGCANAQVPLRRGDPDRAADPPAGRRRRIVRGATQEEG